MRMHTTQEGDARIVAPLEDIDQNTSPILEKEMKTAINEGCQRIILDFSRVTYIESSGIGAIVRAHRLMKEKGGAIVLGGCNEGMQKIFKLVNFQRYFKITGSLQEAMEA